eukprot:COSAG03_NODE_934_length_5267_cov_19.622485_7_plen_126_part_00
MRLHEAAHATGENGVRRPFLTHPAPCTTAHAYAYNESVSMEGVDRIAQIAWARYEGTVRAPVADPVARCIAPDATGRSQPPGGSVSSPAHKTARKRKRDVRTLCSATFFSCVAREDTVFQRLHVS